jgi:hypothetical protein
MIAALLVIWLIVYVSIWLLRIRPESALSRAAFTWIGPRPVMGQEWAAFQARWAMYSFGWLCQIALVFSALEFLSIRLPGVESLPWFLALAFSLALGAGVALLATIGFLLKATKARYLGPNPKWSPPPDDNMAT